MKLNIRREGWERVRLSTRSNPRTGSLASFFFFLFLPPFRRSSRLQERCNNFYIIPRIFSPIGSHLSNNRAIFPANFPFELATRAASRTPRDSESFRDGEQWRSDRIEFSGSRLRKTGLAAPIESDTRHFPPPPPSRSDRRFLIGVISQAITWRLVRVKATLSRANFTAEGNRLTISAFAAALSARDLTFAIVYDIIGNDCLFYGCLVWPCHVREKVNPDYIDILN